MATPTFEAMMVAERKRLTGLLDDVAAKVTSLNTEAAGYKRELAAVNAYDAAKNGKPPSARSGGSRGPRGSKQDTLVALLASHPDGLTRGEIIDALGVKGDKRGEGSVSNALTTMKKAGKLAAKDGRYLSA
jgi:hypothetical protein